MFESKGFEISGEKNDGVRGDRHLEAQTMDTSKYGDCQYCDYVAMDGEVAKVILAGTLTAGDSIAPDADGKAVALGTADGQTYFRSGILLESANPEVLKIIKKGTPSL